MGHWRRLHPHIYTSEECKTMGCCWDILLKRCCVPQGQLSTASHAQLINSVRYLWKADSFHVDADKPGDLETAHYTLFAQYHCAVKSMGSISCHASESNAVVALEKCGKQSQMLGQENEKKGERNIESCCIPGPLRSVLSLHWQDNGSLGFQADAFPGLPGDAKDRTLELLHAKHWSASLPQVCKWLFLNNLAAFLLFFQKAKTQLIYIELTHNWEIKRI